ncbi:hypothetical protein [Microbacterium lacticum]|uniref:hypothetical protein n=1 Tax=Microbacterium lacticum TaxID=33885 RepID=UPI0028D510AA|nr:hypothetical protein [Microbacterium lacticum]
MGESFEDRFEGVEHRDGSVSSAFGLFDDESASAGVVLASDLHDAVVPVHVPGAKACDFGAACGEEGGEHDVIGIGLVHLPARGRELLQRGKVRESVLAERSGGVGDVFAEVAAGAVFGGVDRDDVVADGFVQDPDQGCDGVPFPSIVLESACPRSGVKPRMPIGNRRLTQRPDRMKGAAHVGRTIPEVSRSLEC